MRSHRSGSEFTASERADDRSRQAVALDDAPRRKVVILQSRLLHYRIGLYELLRRELMADGIDLVLIYSRWQWGEGDGESSAPAWATEVPLRAFRLGSKRLLWQPCLRLLRDADLVVVEQASRQLINYVLLAWQELGGAKLAFWGHGKNLIAADASGLGEFLKQVFSRHAHWWFAYTDLSAEIVRGLGYPADRITTVQNALDTSELLRARAAVTPQVRAELADALGLSSDNVGIFIGTLHPEKRLGFLIEAGLLVRQVVPDFELIVIGAGPGVDEAAAAARQHGWIHYVGPKFGIEKVGYFALAKLLLLPGLVGLAMLDALAFEVPLVTTDVPYHSPEIAYLVDGANGVMVSDPDDVAAYAAAIVELLRDDGRRERLAARCRADGERYTIEAMAERFARGIRNALAARQLAR